MKNSIYLLLALLSLSSNLYSQSNSSKTNLVIEYTFSIYTQPHSANPQSEINTKLLIGNNSSLYKATSASSLSKSRKELNADGRNLKYKSNGPLVEQYLRNYDSKAKDLVGRELVKLYYWEQDKSILSWEFMQGEKQFLGYHCSLAKMYSEKMRKYLFAWYTTEIPFPTGPANSGGLPGVILKLEDEDGMVKWEAIKVTKPAVIDQNVWFDKSAIKTTKENFEKAQKAFRENPQLILDQMGTKGRVSGFKVQ